MASELLLVSTFNHYHVRTAVVISLSQFYASSNRFTLPENLNSQTMASVAVRNRIMKPVISHLRLTMSFDSDINTSGGVNVPPPYRHACFCNVEYIRRTDSCGKSRIFHSSFRARYYDLPTLSTLNDYAGYVGSTSDLFHLFFQGHSLRKPKKSLH